MRVCAEANCPELTEGTRCPAHTRTKDRARGTRQQRGYDRAHEQLRRQWLPEVATGRINCARCGLRISPFDVWHLDHTDDRAGYLGPSHAACNVSHRKSSSD